LKILILKNKKMKKLMLLVAVASFAIGTAAYAGGNDKSEKKSCCKAGGAKACGKAETKACHSKDEKASDKATGSDSKAEKSTTVKSESSK
jgi:hypothetical protein